jgi:glycosyltransferase involved in cell wall biosynthesis
VEKVINKNVRNEYLKPIKVARIGVQSIYEPESGADFMALETSKGLSLYGVKTIVYSKKCRKRKKIGNVEEKPVFIVRLPLLDLLSYRLIASLRVSLSDFDIIHYHNLHGAIFSFIPKLFGKKVVVSCHTLEWKRPFNFVIRSMMKIVDSISSLYNSNLITESNEVYDYYKNKGKNIIHIPNGATVPVLQKDKRKEKYILFCSRLVPEKGAHYLITAFQLIKSNYKLYICGQSDRSDSYVNELKKMALNNKNIIFFGHVLGEKKHRLFSNASIYVLPSEMEGMSVSLLEAISYGIPILTSDIKENKTIVKKSGFYFKTKNITSLKNKLLFMLKNPVEIEEKALQARQFVSTHLNWNDISKQYYDFYKSLIRD